MPLLKKKCQIAVKVIDFVIESLETKDIKTLENASIIMRGLLSTSTPDLDWIYKVNIAETANQKSIITEIAVAITDYNKTLEKESNRPKLVLSEQAANLSVILGFVINTKTTSVTEFRAYQNTANEKVKIMNDGRR